LYSDGDEIIFDAQRPVMLTGIEEVATRGDLLDRALIVTLPGIPEDKRRTEESLTRRYNARRPYILGALLDAVAAGLKNLPDVRLGRLPRMADFARWVTACEPALGWPAGSFMAAYASNVANANELALGESAVVAPLREFMALRSRWSGTATELLDGLNEIVSDKVAASRAWPRAPHALSGRLRRLAPNLRRAGLDVTFDTGRTVKTIILTTTGVSPENASQVSRASRRVAGP
jgi:hypothetical protein